METKKIILKLKKKLTLVDEIFLYEVHFYK